jgi:Asp-tRNA(Asn)/Glu-tRNA(Gln) amidotransferase A subunit family amidase
MRSAVDIVSQVRTGRLTATEVVEYALSSAERSQDTINAFTLIDTEGAMARAQAVDMLVEQGKDPGPLAGVPIALKDIIDQAGLPNTRGGSFPVEPSTHSATVVRRLGAAGAVIIGRTNLHEFAFGFTSENHWFGPVHNPWDLTTSAGGSSGGSAAAVAASIVPIGIGTDTGGSVRVPAALCGIFGLKVTHGRVPLTGVYPLVASFDTVGPLARSVDDLTAAYLAMAGDDASDPWSHPAPVDRSEQAVDPSSIRIGIVEQWFDPPHTQHIGTEIDRFLGTCSKAGFELIAVNDESLRPVPEITAASRAEILDVHGERFTAHADRYGPEVRTRLSDSYGVTVNDLVVAGRWISRAKAAVKRLQTDRFTVLLAPTVGVQSKTIGVDDVDIDGTAVFHRRPLAEFTAPINAIGIPSLAMPIMGSGTPSVSLQFAGPPWSEARLLTVGRWLETEGLVGFTPPPLISSRSMSTP